MASPGIVTPTALSRVMYLPDRLMYADAWTDVDCAWYHRIMPVGAIAKRVKVGRRGDPVLYLALRAGPLARGRAGA